jgi:hypothetical protein
MPVAYNEKTGEALALGADGQWTPTRIAQNPQTGERLAFDGAQWMPIGSKPSATAAQPAGPKGDGVGMSALRGAEAASKGFAESILETIGAVPELASAGLRAVGAPAPDAGYYPKALKEGWSALGRTVSAPLNSLVGDMGSQEQSGFERAAYGAGRGLGDVATFAVPGAMAAKFGQAGGLAQRTGAALAANPVLQGAAGATGGAVQEATESPAAGIAAALAVPGLAGAARKAITPVASQLAPEETRLAALAESMGIKLTPGQATGSRPLQTAESVMAQLPFTANKQKGIYDAQRRGFNQAVMKEAGVSADTAAPQVIDDAFNTLGAKFNQLAGQTTVNIDQPFFQQIDAVQKEYGRRLPTDVAPVFQSYMDDLNQMRVALSQQGTQGVQLQGDVYQNVTSNIKRAARNASGRPELQRALNELADTLDDAMARSVSPDVASAWGELRGQYKNLLAIDKAMSAGSQVERQAGNIPFGSFRQAVQGQDKRGFSRGRGDMNDLARVGDFLASKIPDSGTAGRSFMQGLLTGSPVAGAGGAMAMGAEPVTAAAILAATYGTAPLAQALMNSKAGQAYLRNQVAPKNMTGSQRNLLLAKILAGRSLDTFDQEYPR